MYHDDWWSPPQQTKPPRPLYYDWWAPSNEDIEWSNVPESPVTPVNVFSPPLAPRDNTNKTGSEYLAEVMERFDIVLVEFEKWVNARVPLPVSLVEPDIERTLFNILCPPVVDTENSRPVYSTKKDAPAPTTVDLPAAVQVDIPLPSLLETEIDSTSLDAPSLSPFVNVEEIQSIDTDTEKEEEDPTLPPPSFVCQNDTATPTLAPTSVSALTPAESCFIKFSKGYKQTIVDPVKFSTILQLRVNLATRPWLTSPHRPLTCSESGLLPEPPPFPRRFSCSGSMNYVF